MSKQNNNRPIKDFRAGSCRASIWRKDADKNGQTVTRHSVHIEKQYRNKDGKYETTSYFFKNDLSDLALVANKAYEYICLKESPNEDNAPV